MPATPHQYVERETGRIRDERLYGDRMVAALYSAVRENAPLVFRALTSRWTSRWIAKVKYDRPFQGRRRARSLLRALGVDPNECLDPPHTLTSARKVFERKIRYWECRPLPENPGVVVSPADARVLLGSFAETSQIRVKDKFFRLQEFLGGGRYDWCAAFAAGDFAVCRLTPDKYHYNHVPVTGRVADFYELDGHYHSCNPLAVITLVTPYSKNKRVVTILDTDVPGGAQVGLVAMVEVVALMIGEIVQCYSAHAYDAPQPVAVGMTLQRGAPKSLFRPGSSTVVLVFEPGRVAFAADLLANQARPAVSRFSLGFGQTLVETDVKVRSCLAHRCCGGDAPFPNSPIPAEEESP